MKKTWAIIKREYVVRVRTRAFVISTIASPLLLLALALLPGLLATRGGGERHVVVLDQSGDEQLFPAIKNRLDTPGAGRDDAGDRGPRLTNYVLERRAVSPSDNIDEIIRNDYTAGGKKDEDKAYLILPAGLLDGTRPEYRSKNTSDFGLRSLESAINQAVIERKLDRAGLGGDKAKGITRRLELDTKKLTSEGGAQEDGGTGFVVAFVMLFFMYMTVLFYGLFVMRGVIEEKQSRIVEIVVSSVKPHEMMLGKLIGIGLVGLTQIGIWVTSVALLSTVGLSIFASRGVALPHLPPILLVYFVIYFVLGYFLYATLYALVGATVGSEEEAQQAQFPVTILIVIPMTIFTTVVANPNGPLAVTLSMIPFFAPTLMMLRIAVINPPLWQVLLSMAIMVVTILGAVWLAAKIYRVGILMYGKRPSLAELGRWLRYN
ncbi:MAG TPA: ABC transporter permease [Blastocatellia bacterium]|nr:ABC transporter permease [Blastocatellia bacterium]